MKTIHIFLFIILSVTLRAQSIGPVEYGSQIFNTGLSEQDSLMTDKNREIALESIERFFGKVNNYEEFYGDCCGMHHFLVYLESGDVVDFECGSIIAITLYSPTFVAAKEWFKGGLRIGQTPPPPINDKIRIHLAVYESNRFYFGLQDLRDDTNRLYEIDEDGKINYIFIGFPEC